MASDASPRQPTPPAKPFGRCLPCGYRLVNTGARTCPECGHPFDPADAATFAPDDDRYHPWEPPMRPWVRRLRLGVEAIIAAELLWFALLWTSRTAVSAVMWLFGNRGDRVVIGVTLLLPAMVALVGLVVVKVHWAPTRIVGRIRQAVCDVAVAAGGCIPLTILLPDLVRPRVGETLAGFLSALALAGAIWVLPHMIARRPLAWPVVAALVTLLISLAYDVVAWHLFSRYLTPWHRGADPSWFIQGAVAIWLPACIPAWYYRHEPRWRQYLMTALLALLLRAGPCAMMRV